jgi:tRNA threonylcarbamoyladenosine biosynthesis protein TsaB
LVTGRSVTKSISQFNYQIQLPNYQITRLPNFMLLLALDTTTCAGSVALVENDRIVAERRGDPLRTHAERLPRDVLSLLEEHRLSPADVDLFAVASGPGSFTGMRVGIATMQGLAFVQGRRVAAVSALEAIAHSTTRDLTAGAVIGVWMDARRHDVFSALYRLAAHPPFDPRRLVELDGPAVGDPVATLIRWGRIVDRAAWFVGDGAARYGDVLRSRHPDARIIDAPLLAGTIGLMAVARSEAGGTLAPGDVRPLYVRRPDAEVEREKRDFLPPRW